MGLGFPAGQPYPIYRCPKDEDPTIDQGFGRLSSIHHPHLDAQHQHKPDLELAYLGQGLLLRLVKCHLQYLCPMFWLG